MAARTRQVFELKYPNAAGIDIGSASHFVAVPPDRDDCPVREFKSFTEDLLAIVDWLSACEVDSIAMESTGVYWIRFMSCSCREASPCSWSMRVM
jgi:transposase